MVRCGPKAHAFSSLFAGRLAPGSALILSAAKLPQEAHVTGKVTSGRTRIVQSGPSQSPFTETEVRLNGRAGGGRIISRANPKLSGSLSLAKSRLASSKAA